MDNKTLSLLEIRQRFEPFPHSQRGLRFRAKWAAILFSGGAILSAGALGFIQPGWHTFSIPASVLVAAWSWSHYIQLDQKEAILSLVDHIEAMAENMDIAERVEGTRAAHTQ